MKTGTFEECWWIAMFLIAASLVGVSILALINSNLFGLIGLIGGMLVIYVLYQNRDFLKVWGG